MNPSSKLLVNTFCSSLGSTLLFIESTTIHPLYLWVVSDEGDNIGESDSSLSMNTKNNYVHDGKSPNHGKKKHKGVGILEKIEEANVNRFSNRLTPKSDVPIMDREKNRAMVRNLGHQKVVHLYLLLLTLIIVS